MSSDLLVGNRFIGTKHPVYIVAEMSANHQGDLAVAERILRAASEAGADAVKLQTYTADTLTIDSDRDCFRIGSGSLWAGRTLYDLYREASTPWEWHARLREVARDFGLDLFSTPFDSTALEFLEALDMGVYKVSSFELVDTGLLRQVARTGKPVILSTGMASLPEIEEAVDTLKANGAAGIALLKCTSAYPAPFEEANLRTIPDLASRFQVPAGLSDHTLGIALPVAAVALGACIIEKHFTLNRADGGPDAAFSLEPAEFRAMVDAVRATEAALGTVRYEPTEKEAEGLRFRRSLFVVRDIQRGELFTAQNVRSIRPSAGLAPKHFAAVLGKRAVTDIERGTPLAWSLIDIN